MDETILVRVRYNPSGLHPFHQNVGNMKDSIKLLCFALCTKGLQKYLFILQLSQLPLDCKRLTYDALEGANITPTSFYNIGDLEIQDNLARVWCVIFLF